MKLPVLFSSNRASSQPLCALQDQKGRKKLLLLRFIKSVMGASTIIFLFLIVLIGFNIWNGVTLHRLLKRPLKNDQLNDKNYWELKYKMQYMVTAFSVLLAIVAYLGYNTIDNVKESVEKDFQSKLDSTKSAMHLIDSQMRNSKESFDAKIADTDSVLNSYQNMLLGLSGRTEAVRKSIAVSDKDLNDFKSRIAEINSKNIIQL